jgi:predicted phage replisome organizer
MADVKWIKFSTGFPNSRKLKQIRRLPNGDTIALFWVFLVCLAGDINEDGMIFLTKEVPYTEEMLADEFDIDINTIRLGLSTFQKFGMIEVIDQVICLSAWEKWQSTDRLSELREYNRLAKQKSRAKQKLLLDVNDKSMTSQSSQDTDIDKDIDKDKNKKHKYGEYANVLLTDDELSKLKTEYSDYEERIERLSSYVASTGKKYKSHYATIRNWARKDVVTKPKNSQPTYDDPLADLF